MEARTHGGVAAACLLAALDNEPTGTDAHTVRAYAGAVLLAEGLQDLRRIRHLLTPPK